jgi:hypothetical protein
VLNGNAVESKRITRDELLNEMQKNMELTKEEKTCTKSKKQKNKKNEQEETSGKEEG